MGAVLVANRAQLRRDLEERNSVVVSMAKWEIQTVTCLVPSEWDITRYPMATRAGAMQGRLEMRVRYDAYRPPNIIHIQPPTAFHQGAIWSSVPDF